MDWIVQLKPGAVVLRNGEEVVHCEVRLLGPTSEIRIATHVTFRPEETVRSLRERTVAAALEVLRAAHGDLGRVPPQELERADREELPEVRPLEPQ